MALHESRSCNKRTPPMAKKPKKRTPAKSFTMRLPEDIRQKVVDAAEEMGETESLVIRQALRDYFLAKEVALAVLRQEQDDKLPD